MASWVVLLVMLGVWPCAHTRGQVWAQESMDVTSMLEEARIRCLRHDADGAMLILQGVTGAGNQLPAWARLVRGRAEAQVGLVEASRRTLSEVARSEDANPAERCVARGFLSLLSYEWVREEGRYPSAPEQDESCSCLELAPWARIATGDVVEGSGTVIRASRTVDEPDQYCITILRAKATLEEKGFLLRSPVFVYLADGECQDLYILDRVVLCANSPDLYQAALHELAHWWIGWDSYPSRVLVESMASYIVLYCAEGAREWLDRISELRKDYRTVEELAQALPDETCVTGFDTAAAAGLMLYLYDKLGWEVVWRMLYSREDALARCMGKPWVEVVADFHRWLKTHPEERIIVRRRGIPSVMAWQPGVR